MSLDLQKALEEEKTRHKLAVEEEKNRHEVAVAEITAQFNKRKADDIKNEGVENGTTSEKKIKSLALLGDDEEFEVHCNDCGKKEKVTEDEMDSWRVCALCDQHVCEGCARECEECGDTYCKCVHDSDKSFCEDCENCGKFICCNEIRPVPCDRMVCSDCADQFHRGYECNHCLQARKYGGCDPAVQYWG